MDTPTRNDDGSVDITISHASFHILSNEAPITIETGSLVTGPPNVVDETPGGGEGITPIPPIQDVISQVRQNQSNLWMVILISTVTLLVAAAVIVVVLNRRSNTRPA
jgi:hypothetical protein